MPDDDLPKPASPLESMAAAAEIQKHHIKSMKTVSDRAEIALFMGHALTGIKTEGEAPSFVAARAFEIALAAKQKLDKEFPV
jgi:hypothetical protein